MSKCLICNIPQNVLKSFNYSYLTEKDLSKNMNDLLMESNKNIQEISFKQPFIFMHDYSEDEMNQISDCLKENGIHAIYAVSTQHNLQWTLKDLLNELLEEHEIFQTMNLLQNKMKELIPHMNDNQEIKNLLMESFIVLQNKDVNQMKSMIQKLNIKKESD